MHKSNFMPYDMHLFIIQHNIMMFHYPPCMCHQHYGREISVTVGNCCNVRDATVALTLFPCKRSN